MKAIITGAAGLVGSMLALRLGLKDGCEVLAVDNCSRYRFDLLREALGEKKAMCRVRLLKADLAHRAEISPVLRGFGADVIIHLGAVPDERLCAPDPEQCVSTNILGTYHLANAEDLRPRAFIFSSSQTVYGYPDTVPVSEEALLKPMDLYSITKIAGEELVHMSHFKSGASSIILRLSSVYGYGLFARWSEVTGRFVKDALEGRSLKLFRPGNLSEYGAQVADFIHVSDVCDAIVCAVDFAFQHESCIEVFNIGSGQGLSISQLAGIVETLAKDRFGRAVSSERGERNENEVPRMILDISRARSILGWHPKISIEEGINDLMTRYLASAQLG